MKTLSVVSLMISFMASVTLGAGQSNIIFILADDQRNDVLGCSGHPLVQTPTLDHLAAEGVRFENAFCQVPICAASRATFFTGLTQSTHGYNFGEPKVSAEHMSTSYPMVLKSAGYRIGFIGKYGMSYVAPGMKEQFDFYKPISRNPYLKEMPDGSLRHETDLCIDEAIEFLQTNPTDKPFCLSISFNASHAEDGDHRPGFHFQWPESANGWYEDLDMPAPNLDDPMYFDAIPTFLQDSSSLGRQRYFWRWDTPQKYETNMRAYLRMISGIDNAVARLLEAVETEGYDQNTVIIYCADNGFMMGDRGLAGKWNHYEQSLRIPLIVYEPNLPEANQGRVVSQLVSTIDMAPTFLDYAGVEIPDIYQGRSLVPLIQYDDINDVNNISDVNDGIDWREDLFFEHKFWMYNSWYAVRGERFKYALYYDEPSPFECLYDLENDPNELINLTLDPNYHDVRLGMIKRMNAYLATYRPQEPNKPNIVYVFADQLRAHALGCMGNEQVITPHIDQLASEGLLVTNAISAQPVCTPYRAQLMTGRYGHTTGVFHNDIRLPDNEIVLPELMKQQGYTTGYIGKWHLAGYRSDPVDAVSRRGWDYWAVRNCSHQHSDTRYWVNDAQDPVVVDGWEPDVQTDLAIDFIEEHKEGPFCLMVSFGPPHNPYLAPAEYMAMYEGKELEARPNVPNGDTSNLREYYAMTTSVDGCIGRISDALESAGVADNTIFVFTSDHGDMLGSQGEPLKQRPWEESINIPFILRYPRAIAAGQQRDWIVSSVDVMPTLLGLCGIFVPPTVQGMDYSATFLGTSSQQREAAFLFNVQNGAGPGTDWRGIRTKQWVYAYHVSGDWVMYNLENDPYQLTNLVSHRGYASKKNELRSQLESMRQTLGDSLPLNGVAPSATPPATGGR